MLHGSGADLAKELLGVTVLGQCLRAAEEGCDGEGRRWHEARDEEAVQLLARCH